MSSAFNVAAALLSMNTQQLWPLHKTKPAKFPARMGKGSGEPPLPNNYYRLLFLAKGVHWKVIYAPWISPHPVTYGWTDWTQ